MKTRFFCLCLIQFFTVTLLAQENPVKTISAHGKAISDISISRDGKFLATTGEGQNTKLWSYPQMETLYTFKGHSSDINAVALNADGTMIATGGSDHVGNVWETEGGKFLYDLDQTNDEISFYDLAFTPDKKKLVAVGGGVLGIREAVKIYDAQSGHLLKTFKVHINMILSLDLHPDGKSFVTSSASSDGDAQVIQTNIETGEAIRTFSSRSGDVRSVVFSHDGKYLAATADRVITVWETQTGKKITALNGHFDHIMSIMFSPDDKYIVSGSYDKNVSVWSMETKDAVVTYNNGSPAMSVAFTPDGKQIVAGGQNGKVNIWNFVIPTAPKVADDKNKSNALEIQPRVRTDQATPFSSLKEAPELVLESGTHNDIVKNVRYTKDGKEIVTASWDKTVRIWEASTGKLIRTIYVPQYAGIEGQIYALDVSADKKYIAVAGSSVGLRFDKKTENYIGSYVLLIDYKSGKIVDVAADHDQSIFGVAFSPDGKKLASCAGLLDNKVNVYDIDAVNNKIKLAESQSITEVAVKYFPACETLFGDKCNHAVYRVRFSTDSKTIYVVDAHGMLLAYKPKSATTPASIKLIGESAGRKNAVITGKITDKAPFVALALDPKGRYVACGDVAGKVLVFDAKGKDLAPDVKESAEKLLLTIPLRKNDFVQSLDFDPTGELLAVAIGGEVRIYPVKIIEGTPAAAPAPIVTFTDHLTGVNAVAFSPDGASVVSSGGDNNASYVWDAKTGKAKFKLAGEKSNNKITRVGVSRTNPFLIGFGTKLYEFQNQNVNHFGEVTKAFDMKNLRVIDSVRAEDYSTAESENLENHASRPDFKMFFNDDEQMISYLPLKTGATVISTLSSLFLNDAANLLAMTGARSYGMANAKDGETFYIGQSDGQIRIYDTKTLKLVATLYMAANSNEWILFTPDGYYTSSRNGAKLVGWLINDGARNSPKFYPFEQFDLRLNRPDIVLSRIGGYPKKRIDLLYKAYQKRLEKMGVDEKLLSDNLNAPTIELNLPIVESMEKRITFNVKANDNLNNLDRLNIYINDVPLYGSNGLSLKATPAKKLDKQIIAELTNGQNKIQVSVLNSAGIESFQETRYVNYRGAAVTPNLYIVAVGVSSYDDQSFNLQYAAKDAKDIAALYEKQVGKFGVVKTMTILDKEATSEKIKAAKIFLKEARPDDEVILFAAGHGLLDNNLDFYFATTDVDFNNPSVRGLKYDDLEGLLDQVSSRKKLMLIDACHSGEIDKDAVVVTDQPAPQNNTTNSSVKSRGFKNLTNNDLGVTDVFELMRMMFADLRKGSGAMVISSASGVEFAFENDVWKNGVFTYSLLEGIKTGSANLNKDKEIQVSELRDYVIKRVGELTNGKQHPTSRKENLEFDFKVW